MIVRQSPHTRAVLEALFVTFLWSTSWVLIKFGLAGIPALTFAGLRYTLAFLILLPLLVRPAHRAALAGLRPAAWARLAALGLLFYSITQGAQFVGLAYLPAITVNLLLSFTTVAVAVAGMALLAERPSPRQWLGVALYLGGAVAYFLPVSLPAAQIIGILVVLVGVFANAASAILGRYVNRAADVPPVVVTTVSMGIGGSLLLATGVAAQGLPALSPLSWGVVLWLAVVNTALAFTLWNKALRCLTAVESSIINNTMLIQIPIFAWLFLGERLTWPKALALALAGIGILIVQLRRPAPTGRESAERLIPTAAQSLDKPRIRWYTRLHIPKGTDQEE